MVILVYLKPITIVITSMMITTELQELFKKNKHIDEIEAEFYNIEISLFLYPNHKHRLLFVIELFLNTIHSIFMVFP